MEIVIAILMLVGIHTADDPIRVEFGKQCTPADKHGRYAYSYVWVKPAIGPVDVNKQNCKQ
jgi:hypothetical protein